MNRSLKPETTSSPLLELDSVSVEYATDSGAVRALRSVSLEVNRGESLGLAGESGSGKSTLALAVLDYLAENAKLEATDIRFKGRSIPGLSSSELRSIRGNEIAHVPQDPRLSLNPSIRVGKQIGEVLELHQGLSEREARERTYELLDEVNIPEPRYNAGRYPHELSGGMQQRVLIAMALSCDPDLLIMDEPTSGLDVTTEAKILDLVNELKTEYDMSILLITHDLGVIAETTDRVAILYAGELMEVGPTEDVFSGPANPYTQGLLAAVPSITRDTQLAAIPGRIPDLTQAPTGCIFAPRCRLAEEDCRSSPIDIEEVHGKPTHVTRCRRWEEALTDPFRAQAGAPDRSKASSRAGHRPETPVLAVEGLSKHYVKRSVFDRFFGEPTPIKAVDGVDLAIAPGETVGLVGESGCGKSTLARTVVGLHRPTGGRIKFRGVDVEQLRGESLREFRSECEIVFQNPDSSLNPQKSVYEIIERPLNLFSGLEGTERDSRIVELLEQVELGPEYASRYPSQLSGGEKQRVAIARAFATNPSIVILDEPVSALDVSVQANIINLLIRLRQRYACSYLFISHDLSVVNYISDRITIMYLGEIVEVGTTDQVFSPPLHPYTRSLLSNVPAIDRGRTAEKIRLSGDVPSPRDTPSGCPFQTRCPQKIGERCEREHPVLRGMATSVESTHEIACHLDIEELSRERLGDVPTE